MTDLGILVQDTRFRVRLEQDPDREQPDWDGQGHVYYVDWNGDGRALVTVANAETGSADLRSEIAAAYYRFGVQHELVGRYLRIFHEVVAFDYLSWSRGTLLFVVTEQDAERWGVTAGRSELASQTKATWEQWIDGDVWGYVIEERIAYVSMDAALRGDIDEQSPDLEQWEHLDSAWGMYGHDYAEQEALGAFDAVLEDQPTS